MTQKNPKIIMLKNFNREIPKQTAFLIIMIAGLAIAWGTINIGEKIIGSEQQKSVSKDVEILKELDKVK